MKCEFSPCVLPLPVRMVFSTIMFVEAGLLAYILLLCSPSELALALVLTLTGLAVYRLTPLTRKTAADHNLSRLLDELKRSTGLGGELRLAWVPGGSPNLSGEVKENIVYVYDEEPREAAETLVEEFIEYAISEASEPYVSVLNAVLRRVNEEAYRRRDRVAKALAKLLKGCLEGL